MVLGFALNELIRDPGCFITLGGRQVDLVLHHVLEIVSINRDRYIKVTHVNHHGKNRDCDYEFESRAAALATCHSHISFILGLTVGSGWSLFRGGRTCPAISPRRTS